MPAANIRRNIPLILRLLMEGPKTIADLAERTGIRYDTVREFVNELHTGGVVYISGWRKLVKQASPSAVWTLGIGLDAPRPKAKTGAQRTQAWHQRKTHKPLTTAPKRVVAPASVFDLGRHMGVDV